MEEEKKYRILNRDVIKYIAMLTMLLNHIATIFMETGTFWSEFFLDIGYFTAITMCYFLVEGFRHTRSKKKYGIRLAVFALISEIPYCLAFTEDGILEFYGLNMMFTLLICFLILLAVERIANRAARDAAVAGLTLLSLISDWALLAPVFTLLFLWAEGSRERTKAAFVFSTLLFGMFNFLGGVGRFPVGTNILYTLGSMAGIALAGIVIVCLYNGRRMKAGKNFSKWFFYFFYPLHLLLLGMLRIFLSV